MCTSTSYLDSVVEGQNEEDSEPCIESCSALWRGLGDLSVLTRVNDLKRVRYSRISLLKH